MSLDFTDTNFESEVLKSNVPVLVDFSAEWCGQCQMVKPILEEVAEAMKGKKAKVGKVDVDTNSATAQKYEILSIPVLMFFKDGKEVKRFSGAQSKEDLIKELDKLIS